MKKKKQRGSLERVTGTIFILVLFVFLLINIIVPDKEKSVQENRMLASAPKWNWGNVISGDYMEKFERYMSDQFVGRDFWRTIKVGVDRLAGVSKEHGVYIGKDGQLLEEIELPNQEYLADNLKSIQNFAEYGSSGEDDACTGCGRGSWSKASGYGRSGESDTAHKHGKEGTGKFR